MSMSVARRLAISKRMRANNPMKRADVVEKVKRGHAPEYRAKMSDLMKKTWQEGKIIPSMFLGNGSVKGANKTERMLFPLVRRHCGRFVGDGKFWVRLTESGISRNPDFIFGSGKNKIALLVHGVYWHRDKRKAKEEINDYLKAGWHLFVLWTGDRISHWMMAETKERIALWLKGVKSSPSKTPECHQFMTWNARRITTSSRKG